MLGVRRLKAYWLSGCLAVLAALVLAACGAEDDAPDAAVEDEETGDPDAERDEEVAEDADPVSIEFWHVYDGLEGQALNQVLDGFATEHPHVTVESVFVGGYGELSSRVITGLEADEIPNLVVGFNNATIDYAVSGEVMDLRPWIDDPDVGLDEGEYEDFVRPILARNEYLMFPGEPNLSLPWTLSVGVMYVNTDMLSEAGVDDIPSTWDEFEATCATVMEELGNQCWAIAPDASHFSAFGFTRDAQIFDPDTLDVAFGDPEWLETMEYYTSMAEQDYAYATVGRADVATADIGDFASELVPFFVKSSRFLEIVDEAVGGRFEWTTAPLPQDVADSEPTTVLYGPNVQAFHSDAPEEEATWLLIRYLTRPDAQLTWASATGNLPVRYSVLEGDDYQGFLAEDPRRRAAAETVDSARPEDVSGNGGLRMAQPFDLRLLAQDVETDLLTGAITPEEGQRRLVEEGQPIVEEYRTYIDDLIERMGQ